jgi:two-component system response regulator PilR (NtrC family)/two-component system response regulator AtoC
VTSSSERILVVDDDKAFRVAALALLQDDGFAVTAAVSGAEALQKIADTHFDLILSDLVMEGMNGMQLLQHIKQKLPDACVIMITGFGSIKTAVEAMREGAYDYLTKPCDNDELLIRVRRALTERRKSAELERLREMIETTYNFGNIISRNERMQQAFKLVRQVAETDVTVLVLGETGTGKELVARAIHFNSTRRDRPFITINCSAIPETLLESELFGHEKGAFTGANKQRVGKFEEAEGGTVFLDEIADLPLHVQTKLLRFLQEKQVERVGGNVSITLDVRVVAATNRDLTEMVRAGTLREDLYYRLNVFPIPLPPLRERTDDIPVLAEYFLRKHQSLARQQIAGFSPSVIHQMMNYEWKGNVRELENLIKRAIIKADRNTITALELPQQILASSSDEIRESPATTSVPYKNYLDHVVRDAEQKYLFRALKECKGNLNQAAKMMDVDRKTVYRKIEEYKIDVSQFKE